MSCADVNRSLIKVHSAYDTLIGRQEHHGEEAEDEYKEEEKEREVEGA